MSNRRELLAFSMVLAALVGVFLGESLVGGKVLSPADVVYAQASFGEVHGPDYEPSNRLLIDPVLQFQPWLEFNRTELRAGRLPLWNPLVGCGAPHLANGQSAVFDPFNAIAYVGRLPDALAWIAAARLWVAGLGMFLLARLWGFGAWGRWFSGLAFPFCGFLIVWLQYPVTSVAVWMPWLFWASRRVLDKPAARRVGVLGLIVGCIVLGGHVQTSAHVLIGATVYVVWWIARCASSGPLSPSRERVRVRGPHSCPAPFGPETSSASDCPLTPDPSPSGGRGGIWAWAIGMLLGVTLAAIEIIPLATYLTRSPVWADRSSERPSIWTFNRPRLLDSACTAFPYLYGSQRRGHPNLARALGVHNLNESAGGFAGLATLVWLAPIGFAARVSKPEAKLLAGMVVVAGLAAFEVPPAVNALRAVPVVNVIDHRRLTLWIAFGLVLLGGIGLDRLELTLHRRGRWLARLGIVMALILVVAAVTVKGLEPRLRAKAIQHYAEAADRTPGADPIVFLARAERQVRQTLTFLPRYLLIAAAHGLTLSGLAIALRRGKLPINAVRAALLALTLIDLIGFGFGLNPAIDRADDRPISPVIAYLRREAPPPSRILAVGSELPPNVLMRYGLADVRNYDSIEATSNLDGFASLYEDERGRPSRTSRRPVTWRGVVRARDQLRAANVTAVVGATPPPVGVFDRVDRVGSVWVGRWDVNVRPVERESPGEIGIDLAAGVDHRGVVAVAESFDPGWRAEADGRPAMTMPLPGGWLGVRVPPNPRAIHLGYDPLEVRLATAFSLSAMGAIGVLLAVGDGRRATARKPRAEAWIGRFGRVRIESMTSSR